MTTIVYCKKTNKIAIDSRTSAGSLIVSDHAKKFSTDSNGNVWFMAGRTPDTELAAKLLADIKAQTFSVKDENELEYSGFVVSDGVVYSLYRDSDNYHNMHETRYSESFGSGGMFALAALDFDKSAKEAVEYAKTRDCYTGGKVHVFHVNSMTFV